MHYPSYNKIKHGPNGAKLLEVHRSVLSILTSIFWFFVSLFCSVIILYKYGSLTPTSARTNLHLRWILLIPGVQLLAILRLYHDNLYVFYKTKITHLGGRLSLQYFVPDVSYSNILTISVHQGILNRILNIGDVQIDTAALDKSEILIRGVRAPYELADIIESFRADAFKTHSNI